MFGALRKLLGMAEPQVTKSARKAVQSVNRGPEMYDNPDFPTGQAPMPPNRRGGPGLQVGNGQGMPMVGQNLQPTGYAPQSLWNRGLQGLDRGQENIQNPNQFQGGYLQSGSVPTFNGMQFEDSWNQLDDGQDPRRQIRF